MNQEACLDAHNDTARPSVVAALSLPVTWAACCGALAAGLGAFGGLALLRLLASWLVADAALGCVWAQLRALKAQERRLALADRSTVRGPLVVPYAESGSAGERLAARLNVYLSPGHGGGWARLAQPVTATLVGAGIALVIATFVGPSSLLVAGSALVSAALVSLCTGSSTIAQSEWARGLQMAAAWLLGRVALAPWQRWAWLPALLVGLWGYAQARREREEARFGVWMARVAYAGAAAALLVFRQPLPAVAVALAALSAETSALPARRTVPWLASALLLALAAPYWV